MDAQQLAQVESLCDALYTAADEHQRKNAQQQLVSLSSSAELVPQCQYILANSRNPYAQLIASNALTTLVTTYWNSYTKQQRVEIRDHVLGMLATMGPGLKDFVVTSLVQMVCRITKLGWFDDDAHRHIVEEASKFLSATTDHYIIGLRILNQLVDELNIPTK
jgi:exportin-7